MTQPERGVPAMRGSSRTREAVAQQVRGNWIDVAGLQVYYRSAGEYGPCLLLIHGGGSDHSGFAWKYTIEALATDYRVIAVDLPGYGNSHLTPWFIQDAKISGKYPEPTAAGGDAATHPANPDPHTFNLFSYHIDFIAQFLDALGLSKTHLMGLSMGGGIALGFALRYPQRVDRLILVNSYGLGRQVVGGFFTYMATRAGFIGTILRFALKHSRALVRCGLRWVVHRPEAITDELVSDALHAIRKKETHPAWRVFQWQEISLSGFRTIFSEALPRLTAPTLYVHAAHDRLIPPEHSRQAHERTPDARLVIMENVGHLIPREKPEEFHRIVRAFLRADER